MFSLLSHALASFSTWPGLNTSHDQCSLLVGVTYHFVIHTTRVLPGAIIGDGDRKRALILLYIGAVPMMWDNFSIFRTNCAIACGTRAHLLRWFPVVVLCMSRGGNDVRIPKMFDAFGPQQPTTQYVHICWSFTSVVSSYTAPVWVK